MQQFSDRPISRPGLDKNDGTRMLQDSTEWLMPHPPADCFLESSTASCSEVL